MAHTLTSERSNIPTVKRYVLNQEKHHSNMSYEDELFSLLHKHGIEFDLKRDLRLVSPLRGSSS